MNRKWLVRKTDKKIIGPFEKQDIVDKMAAGEFEVDDEVCSGNGYWFSIKEEKLVDRFLLGTELQSFHPISQINDVLTVTQEEGDKEGSISSEETEDESRSSTMVVSLDKIIGDAKKSRSGKISTKIKKMVNRKAKLPDNQDLEYPTLSSIKKDNKNRKSIMFYILTSILFFLLLALFFFAQSSTSFLDFEIKETSTSKKKV